MNHKSSIQIYYTPPLADRSSSTLGRGGAGADALG